MIFSPRWSKVRSDFFGNKIRTVLVVLSIAVGVFAVGTINNMFQMMTADMEHGYNQVNAHGAIIYCDIFNDDLLTMTRRFPGVSQAEGRSVISARANMGANRFIPMEIQSIAHVSEMTIDQVRLMDEAKNPEPDFKEILIDRTAFADIARKAGEDLILETPSGQVKKVRIKAYVFDATGIPYQFYGQARAFVTTETMEWLGGTKEFNQLLITVKDRKTDEEHVREIARAVADKIEKGGRQVYFTFVYQPGRHFASDIVNALNGILGALGILLVFLSAFLVVNTISALISQHIRQIGMMKAVGAQTFQIVNMYLILVFTFGLAGLLIGMPLSGLASYAMTGMLANMLNFIQQDFYFTQSTIIMEVLVAFLIPIGAALAPILSGTRMTVREALSNYGIGAAKFGRSLFDRLVDSIRFLSRPILLSLRNVFRKKGRLILTLSTLTLGGAIFLGVFNLRAAMNKMMVDVMGYFLSDVNISLSKPYRVKEIENMILTVPTVVSVEGWGFSTGEILSEDKSTSTEIMFFAPPSSSKLIRPVLNSGRWLVPEDENAVVIGNQLEKVRPDIHPGDTITIKIKNKKSDWKVVGVYRMAGNMITPLLYTNSEYLARARNEPDISTNFRLVTSPQTVETQRAVVKNLEVLFKAKGVDVSQMTAGLDDLAQQTAQTDVIVYILLIMAILIALVGGLGLTGTMSMNVMERTREIGVMRAIGASNFSILSMVILEGLMIGIISWGLGTIAAFPISYLLDEAVGTSMMNGKMDFVFSWEGFILWFVIVVVLSTLASIFPARNAARLTIREVLAYE